MKNTDDSQIHIRVPAAIKSFWIGLSRARGIKLTDWILEAVEYYISNQLLTVKIPDGLEFSDLQLERDPDGEISLNQDVIKKICAFNNLPDNLFEYAPDEAISQLIIAWYQDHRKRGGKPDRIAETLIVELAAGE